MATIWYCGRAEEEVFFTLCLKTFMTEYFYNLQGMNLISHCKFSMSMSGLWRALAAR